MSEGAANTKSDNLIRKIKKHVNKNTKPEEATLKALGSKI